MPEMPQQDPYQCVEEAGSIKSVTYNGQVFSFNDDVKVYSKSNDRMEADWKIMGLHRDPEHGILAHVGANEPQSSSGIKFKYVSIKQLAEWQN